MVTREYGECSICEAKLLLRVGVGNEKACPHTFDCPKCGTPITLTAMTGEPPAAWIEMGENIRSALQTNDDENIVINLHPSFAFDLNDYHSKYAFASMRAGNLIGNRIRVPADSRHVDIALDFEVPNTLQLWPMVRSVLTLAIKGDPASVISKHLGRYEALRRETRPNFKAETPFKCAATFFDDIFYPAIGELRSPLRAFAKQQKSAHRQEFQRMSAYYETDLAMASLDRYVATFNDYFRYFDQFRQILVHSRVGDEAVDELIVGSKRFDEIKLYYGQAYETLTSAHVFPAMLFNMNAGRPFDAFASMTLRKYLAEVDKAKRSAPFMGIPTLAALTRFEDSALRNGSHHASIRRQDELIKFRSGGAGAERDMSFGRYLHTCNGITIALAAVFLVEMEFLSALRFS